MNELYKCLLALTALVSFPPGQAVAADHRGLACVGVRSIRRQHFPDRRRRCAD